MRSLRFSILVPCLIALIRPSIAQSPYSFNTGRELAIVVPALVFHGTSLLFPVPADRLWQHVSTVDRMQLPAFDRHAAFLWSPGAARTTDILLVAGIGGSVAMALLHSPSKNLLQPAALMGESLALTTGLTDMVKVLVHRPRPYAYNPDLPVELRSAPEAYVSFWSGHTATTAAAAFTCADIVQHSDASATAKTITWVSAATLPAVVGFYRVRAGQHFPSDVIVGYLVGAGIGMAVPYIHRLGDSAGKH